MMATGPETFSAVCEKLSNVCLSPSNTVPVKSVNSRTARTVASARFWGRTRLTRKFGDSCTPMRPVPSALVSGTTVRSTDCRSLAPGAVLDTVMGTFLLGLALMRSTRTGTDGSGAAPGTARMTSPGRIPARAAAEPGRTSGTSTPGS
uniref:Uncharacterized protein n=1 Tax=Arundo donax TaxID=35708 RepID=A0A0A9F541_ARUDO